LTHTKLPPGPNPRKGAPLPPRPPPGRKSRPPAAQRGAFPLEVGPGGPEGAAAHGAPSYMACARDGDAGTAVGLDDALAEIASGESERLTEMLDKAPPGPIKTKWGFG